MTLKYNKKQWKNYESKYTRSHDDPPSPPFYRSISKLEISPPFVNEVLNLLINWLLAIRVATLWMTDTQKKNKIYLRGYKA